MPTPDFDQVDALVQTLSDAIKRVESEAQSQLETAILAATDTLFPILSGQFLAEEIAQHLRSLVPVSVSAVEITAPPSLIDALRDAVGRTDRLASLCTIVEQDGSGDPRVDVSWQTGGLTFDFDSLLAACRSRLAAT